MVRLGGGGGVEMIHVSGGRGFAWGFRGGRGEKAVEQSGLAGSDAPVPSS